MFDTGKSRGLSDSDAVLLKTNNMFTPRLVEKANPICSAVFTSIGTKCVETFVPATYAGQLFLQCWFTCTLSTAQKTLRLPDFVRTAQDKGT